MRTKICGITNLNDALFALKNGAWALGFNFYRSSPRCISPKSAKEIIDHLPTSIIKIGIFIDLSYSMIEQEMANIGLDLAQIYADIPCSHIAKQRMILSLQASSEKVLPTPKTLHAYRYILLDAPKIDEGVFGGTGRICNWNLAQKLSKDYSLILAGGLQPNNIRQAIETVNPYAVDVASGVENSIGKKDKDLIKQFLTETKNVK